MYEASCIVAASVRQCSEFVAGGKVHFQSRIVHTRRNQRIQVHQHFRSAACIGFFAFELVRIEGIVEAAEAADAPSQRHEPFTYRQ